MVWTPGSRLNHRIWIWIPRDPVIPSQKVFGVAVEGPSVIPGDVNPPPSPGQPPSRGVSPSLLRRGFHAGGAHHHRTGASDHTGAERSKKNGFGPR